LSKNPLIAKEMTETKNTMKQYDKSCWSF